MPQILRIEKRQAPEEVLVETLQPFIDAAIDNTTDPAIEEHLLCVFDQNSDIVRISVTRFNANLAVNLKTGEQNPIYGKDRHINMTPTDLEKRKQSALSDIAKWLTLHSDSLERRRHISHTMVLKFRRGILSGLELSANARGTVPPGMDGGDRV